MIRLMLVILLSLFFAAPCRADDTAPAGMDAVRAKAEQGQAAFQAYLGSLYLHGQGGMEQNNDEAFKWFHRAADQGYPAAQYNLGVMYDEGLGVEQSHAGGYFWLTLACRAAKGKPEYVDRRDKAAITLTMTQMEALEKRAAAWKPVMSAPVSAVAAAPPPAHALAPGVPVPLFRLPPIVQKTINDNVGPGCSIGKIEKAVEDGVSLYRAQINKPGAVSNIVRVGESGKLISIGAMQ